MSKKDENNEDFSDIDLSKLVSDIEALQLTDKERDDILTVLYDLIDASGFLSKQGTNKHEIFGRMLMIASKRFFELGMSPEELLRLKDHAKKLMNDVNEEFQRPTPKNNTNPNLSKELEYLNGLNKSNKPITKSDIQDLVIDLNITQDVNDFINKL